MTDKELLDLCMIKYISLTPAESEHFCSLLKIKTFKRGESIHRIGKICNKAFFILEGCIRYYNIVDGEEITGQFFFEGAWYSDYESFLLEIPSEQTIEAIETTRVAILSKCDLNKLFIELPKFERFRRLMAENAFMGLRKRTDTLTHLSTSERYVQLSQNRPKVIQRVPQKYIASYLSIKPQSLSRIRRELLKK
ncbi:MAG: Crp/Fnr family transcriptional regulator [Bacteroidota bacterium]